ncbi:hypothetical protein EYR36_011762 [Pleurotus pulmonarius]|nr:hypothetical protein EYR36_011762 [Pleurotus pulmonarius]KAF4607336.1 hypothetical protein EYR38_001404 [Pleurotus pulmonarius]
MNGWSVNSSYEDLTEDWEEVAGDTAELLLDAAEKRIKRGKQYHPYLDAPPLFPMEEELRKLRALVLLYRQEVETLDERTLTMYDTIIQLREEIDEYKYYVKRIGKDMTKTADEGPRWLRSMSPGGHPSSDGLETFQP